ncbi:hypothetical protein SAMN05192573_102348 [Mucilaginibacter gossypii]|uniref:Uncharacterized protein n=1 Tax=Mucilaginibacter gossypii TaxID=551996 RepID=A0A1G7RSL9_9SPHI|nr:hypothetical protein SAMN05192573_102348 [Mucilaginibacter gossypii]
MQFCNPQSAAKPHVHSKYLDYVDCYYFLSIAAGPKILYAWWYDIDYLLILFLDFKLQNIVLNKRILFIKRNEHFDL